MPVFPYQFIPCRTRGEYPRLEDESFDIAIDARIDEGLADQSSGGHRVYHVYDLPKVVRRDFDGEIQTVATADGSSGQCGGRYTPNAEKILCATWQDAAQTVKDLAG